jgi:hypothetical protein
LSKRKAQGTQETRPIARRATKHKPARFHVDVGDALTFLLNYDTEMVEIRLDVRAVSRWESPPQSEAVGEPFTRNVKIELPMSQFQNEQHVREYCAHLSKSYHETLDEYLVIESIAHLQLVGNFLLHSMGIEKIDLGTFIDEAAKFRARDTKRALRLTQRGQPREWTAVDLTRAVRVALDKLGKTRLFTLAEVAKRLREDHGERAPKVGPKGREGDSLGKLLAALGVDWKGLRREATARVLASQKRK